jgi:hypothetical protein
MHRTGKCLEIVGISTDHHVAAPECTLKDSRIDDVGGPACPADSTRLLVARCFDVDANETSGQKGLT